MILDIVNQNLSLSINDVSPITLSIQGNQGPAGSNISTYAVRLDQIDNVTIYRGEATPGSLENQSSWRIQKLVISDNDITITWANGNSIFDKIWTNRLSYTYL
jgi:hypothetical protein